LSVPLPPRARLAHVVRSLAAALPAQVGTMLDAPRFAEGRELLRSVASHADRTAAALSVEEAEHLASVLLDRWRAIAEPVLEPAVAIVAPDEIWLADRATRVEITLATWGLEDDWEAVWEGSVVESTVARGALLVAAPPEGDAPASAFVRARVRARALGGARLLLIAEAAVRLRRPVVLASDDARRLIVRDHTGSPAIGVHVEAGEQRAVSAEGGLVEFPEPLVADVSLRVEGALAGRLRAR